MFFWLSPPSRAFAFVILLFRRRLPNKNIAVHASPDFYIFSLLLRLQYLLNSLDYRGLDLIQALHHLLYARSIDWVDLEPRLFCLSLKLRILESIDKGFLQYSHALFGDLWRKRIEPLFAVSSLAI